MDHCWFRYPSGPCGYPLAVICRGRSLPRVGKFAVGTPEFWYVRPVAPMRDVAAIMVTPPWITGCIWSVRCLHVRKLRFSVHSTVVCTCSRCQVKVFVSHSANHPFFLDRSRIRDANQMIAIGRARDPTQPAQSACAPNCHHCRHRWHNNAMQ